MSHMPRQHTLTIAALIFVVGLIALALPSGLGSFLRSATANGPRVERKGKGLPMKKKGIVPTPASPAACTPPPAGLVAWYPMDGNVNDIQSQNNGTLFGNPMFMAGKVSQALQFDGADDHVKVAASSSLNVGAGSGLTIDAWINPLDVSPHHPLIEWNNNTGNIGAHFWISETCCGGSGGNLFANLVDTNGSPHIIQSADGIITANTYQYVTVTYDKTSGIATLYRNGGVVAQQNLGSFMPQTTYDLYFGLRPSGSGPLGARYNGAMDEVEIFNRALSSSEIQAIYNAGSAGKCGSTCTPVPANAIAWFKGEGNANDFLGNYNGTAQGNVTYVPGKIGQAFSFSGNLNELVSVENFPVTRQFTVEGWIKLNTLGDYYSVFGPRDFPPAQYSMYGYGAPNGFVTTCFSADEFQEGSCLPYINDGLNINDTTTFHHIAVSHDGNIESMYLDGQYFPNTNGGNTHPRQTLQETLSTMEIGGVSGYSGAGVTIDELTIYNRGLSAAEVISIYNAGSAGKCQPGALTSLTLLPAAVIGGQTTAGTVTLDSPAPTGGALVSLASNNVAVATVPASVTVNEGASSANFTVTTAAVATPTSVSISATYNNDTKTATLTVNPNTPPTVSITSPAPGATFIAPAAITINADAADSDGTISSVGFYANDTLLGADTVSPYSFAWANVAAGNYTLTAKATDDLGRLTTSSPINIVVNAPDTTPPNTALTGGPGEGANICDGTAIFSFTGTDDVTAPGSLQYRYKLDDGPWQGPTANTSVTFDSLGDGPHTFEVAAVDAAGNTDPTPAVRNFNVDVTVPAISNARAVQVGAAVAGILWETNKSATAQVEFRLLGETAWELTSEDVRYATTHGVPLTGLRPNSTYEYRVRSRDNCARLAVSAILNFQTLPDTDAPLVSITAGPRDGGAVQPGPVVFAWTGVDDATRPEQLRYQYQLDGGALTPAQPQPLTTVTLDVSALGQHNFKVYATDEAGNTSLAPASVNFNVDATAPGVTNLFISDITFVSARVNWTTDEPTSGTVQYALSDGEFVHSFDEPSLSTTHSLVIGPLGSDTAHRVRVIARDEAGNQLVSPEANFISAKLRDLSIASADLSFSSDGPASGDSITLTALVRNTSDLATTATLVFYDFTAQQGSREISRQSISIPAHAPDSSYTSAPFLVVEGLHSPYAQLVSIAPGDDISGNNAAGRDLLVAAPPARFALSLANPRAWPGSDRLFTAIVKNTGSSPQALTGAQVNGVSWVTLASTLPATPLTPGQEAQLTFRLTPPANEPGGTPANPLHVPATLVVAGAQAPSLNFSIDMFSGPVTSLDVTIVNAATQQPIQGATVALDNTDRQWFTNAAGKPIDEFGQLAFLGTTPGTQVVAAAASGYAPGQISTDGSAPVVLALNAGRGLEISEVRVVQLTPAEIAARGVNLADPNNYFVFDFILYMRIGPLPIRNVVLPRVPGAGFTYSGGGSFTPGGGGGGGGPVNVQYNFVYTSPTERHETWIVIPGDIRILKQFWEASVLVRNASTAPINNVRASLDVPNGLALPELFGQLQQQTQVLGTIPAGGARQAQWIVRGDRAGRYRLTGRAMGDGVSPVSLQSSEFEVAQPRLRVTFDTPTDVSLYLPFDIGINIRNDSPIDLQGVQVNIHPDRLVNCTLDDVASKEIGTIAVGQTKTATFRFISLVSGHVLDVGYYISPAPLEPPVEIVPGPAPPPPPSGVFPRDMLISEFRLRGPNGAHDEFVELYNNTDANVRVGTFDGSAGWTLAGLAPDGASATPKFVIPNNTIIPARGHYLATNSDSSGGGPYSLGQYAAGDLTYTNDLADNAGIALFRTADPANLTVTTMLDAVGFAGPSGPVANLYREGAGLTMFDPGTAEYSWVRSLTTGVPQDTNNNAADFVLVATTGGTFGATQAILGAPGPENLASPLQRNATIKASLIEPQQVSSSPPNRVRDNNATGPNAAFGTLDIRRRFTNTTGQMVTALRFRVVDVTTLNTPNPGGAQADLRLLNSTDLTDIVTSRGTLTLRGTMREPTPAQSLGGGLNSSVNVALPGAALAPGATIDVRLLLGVEQGGRFRFFVNVEALTGPAAARTTKSDRKLPARR